MNSKDHIISVKRPKNGTKRNPDISIILLSAKPGVRMKSYGPPSLLPLGSHALIDIQIEAIRAAHKTFEIVLCCGFEANKIIKYVKNKYKSLNIRIVENQKFEEHNCCESLRLCLNNIHSTSIMVCNGELLLYPEMVKVHQDKSYLLTQHNSKKITNLEVGSVVDEDNIVSNICYGLPNIWSEVFYINGKDSIEALRKIVSSEGYKNKFVFEALNDLSKSKHIFRQQINKNSVVKIDDMKTYHNIKEKYESTGTQLFIRHIN
jgi:CTP:phosphocholine cytidylyltransferase-like protein